MKSRTMTIPIIGFLLAACSQPPASVNTKIPVLANNNQPAPSQASASVQSVGSPRPAQDNLAQNKTVNKKELLIEARAILREIKSMESEGRNIPRRTQAAHDNCMNNIKSRWQRVQALRNRVEQLPKVLQLYLGTAGGELISCVSCGSDAVSYCDQTKYWINNAEKTISQYASGEIQ